ncbi:hypothetical protein LCGC14_1489090 [marine sediment metagenome]|uniref:Uncharacterized protein n=1 Tax=marine sediment metagenome TaxID=412755 RepID=A0A0F9JT52_9ZZZZ
MWPDERAQTTQWRHNEQNSSKGYTEDNCRVILWALNAAFGSWGEAVFRDISLAWLERSEAKPTNSYIMAA